jgi:hypothetical protein
MTRPPDTERLIASYLEEGVTELPDRVYDVVRSEVDQTRQRVVVGPWRTPDMNSFAKLAIAAAAVVVVAIAGYNLLPSRDGVGTPSASPSLSPSPTPVATPVDVTPSDSVHRGSLQPGTYTQYAVDGTAVNVRFTVPAGWRWEGTYLTTGEPDGPGRVAIAIWGTDIQVYSEPCQWEGAEPDPRTGPTARAVIDALAGQPTRNASAPRERKAASLDGPNRWSGWAVDVTVPDDADFTQCDLGQFRSWGPEANARYHQGPGQRDTVWAVDVQGTRIVIDASSFPTTSDAAMSEMNAIVDSMVFGHWG